VGRVTIRNVTHNEHLYLLFDERVGFEAKLTREPLSVLVTLTLLVHMKWLNTVPTKPSIFALYRSLLRQTRLLPHEYLRYFLAILPLLYADL
jgi:hypothetical protein